MSVEFKVGDKVRIREWQDMVDEFGINEDGNIPCNKVFTVNMKFLCGKDFVIEDISGYGTVDGLDSSYIISTDMIVPVNATAKLKYDLEKMKAKIKEIEERIVEVEAEEEEVRPQNISGIIDFGKRVETGESYFHMTRKDTNYYIEDNDPTDESMYEIANYFETKEAAERATFERNLYFKLMRYSHENGGTNIDWTDTDSPKYQIYYNYEDDALKVAIQRYHRRQGSIYFATERAAESAINEFEEELIRYFTTRK